MIRKNRKIKLLLTLFGIIIGGILYSQNGIHHDSLFARNIDGKELVIEYTVKPGNTVYGISRQFGVSVLDIYEYNMGLGEAPLAIGSVINVPYRSDILVSELQRHKKNTQGVYYRVGQRETLFRIARVYTGIDAETLKKINNLKDNSLRAGQLLYLGYIDQYERSGYIASAEKPQSKRPTSDRIQRINPITGEAKSDPASSVAKSNTIQANNGEKETLVGIISSPEGMNSNAMNTGAEMNLTSQNSNGIAVWNRESRVRGVYVLSNDAALNTMMEISNPISHRKIIARVIGNIPENTFADNVKVVLSPDAAMNLGALDTRFFVRLQYLK
jgi:LysM repeat protein